MYGIVGNVWKLAVHKHLGNKILETANLPIFTTLPINTWDSGSCILGKLAYILILQSSIYH